jgi:predicted DNA-binding protein
MHEDHANKGPEMVAISVRVPRATADRLKLIADAEFRPVAAEVRRLIEAHVEAEDMKAAA